MCGPRLTRRGVRHGERQRGATTTAEDVDQGERACGRARLGFSRNVDSGVGTRERRRAGGRADGRTDAVPDRPHRARVAGKRRRFVNGQTSASTRVTTCIIIYIIS